MVKRRRPFGSGALQTWAGVFLGRTNRRLHGHSFRPAGAYSLDRDLTDHLILISCSGGAPYEGQTETSTGVWGGLLSQEFVGIVLCRWDVVAEASVALVEKLIRFQERQPGMPIAEALVLAQREMFQTGEWAHPLYWAGLEYWGL